AYSNTNLFVDDIDYANVELHNGHNLYSNLPGAGGFTITGGAHGGQFNQYLGLSAAFQSYSYLVSGNANANIIGIWNETPATLTNLLKVTGTGTVTYAGSMFEMPTTVPNSAAITNFTGVAALVGLFQQRLCPGDGPCGNWGNFRITGSG